VCERVCVHVCMYVSVCVCVFVCVCVGAGSVTGGFLHELKPRLRPETQVGAGGRGFAGNDSPRGDEKWGRVLPRSTEEGGAQLSIQGFLCQVREEILYPQGRKESGS
jgi:hypothetical protein